LKFSLRFFFAVLSILIYGQLLSQPVDWPNVNKTELNNLVWQSMSEYQIPGAQVVLFTKNKVKYSFSGGVANVKTLEPITPKTSFETASLSKPVFHLILRKLVERGALPSTFFSDTLAKYIDTARYIRPAVEQYMKGLHEFLVFNEQYSQEWFYGITIKQLLTHTGGIVGITASKPGFVFRPGQQFYYCDECYILLQRVVENYLDMSLQQLADKYLPNQCKGVSHFAWNGSTTDYAYCHNAEMDFQRDIWKAKEGIAHGTLYASALKYAKFMQYVVNEKLWELNHDTMKVTSQISWQPGWGIEMTEKGSINWHWGNDGCYQHYMAYMPGQDFGMIIFTNSNNGMAMSKSLATQLYGFKFKAMSWVMGEE